MVYLYMQLHMYIIYILYMNLTISRKKILLVRLLFVCNTAVNGLSSIYFCNQLFVRGGGGGGLAKLVKFTKNTHFIQCHKKIHAYCTYMYMYIKFYINMFTSYSLSIWNSYCDIHVAYLTFFVLVH